MILYYTGTGNSEYVASRISNQLNDECINVFSYIKKQESLEIHSNQPFIVVCPTYGWQIPHILRDWLKKSTFVGSKDIYFVMTCGEDIGNASLYVERLCKEINMNYKGCAEIVMPENYIAMFNAPNEQEAISIVKKANPKIDEIINLIKGNKFISNKSIHLSDKLKSGIVNKVFYSVFVHAKSFTVNDSCISCGKCVNNCILNNISLVSNKPSWNDTCTHCMACICGCPTKAIEYGKKSINKPRYQCPKEDII